MMNKEDYKQIAEKHSPNSKTPLNCLKAFVSGGAVCALGQGIFNLYSLLNVSAEDAKLLCSCTLIFIGIVFTALHLYEKLAKFAGAGTLVPITGFANSMAASAIEFKSEGLITGLGAKIFIICGPVIAYGVFASALYGVVVLIFK